MSAPVRIRVREEDYLANMTGEKPSLEFVNGEVFAKPLTKKPHADVARKLARSLFAYEEANGGYVAWETTTNLSTTADRRYRVPDLAFWEAGRPVAHENNIYRPPTAAIEIRSEGQALDDLRAKCREYRERGVDVCWLIDPGARSVEVFDSARDGDQLQPGTSLESAAMPGFALPLDELWQALDS